MTSSIYKAVLFASFLVFRLFPFFCWTFLPMHEYTCILYLIFVSFSLHLWSWGFFKHWPHLLSFPFFPTEFTTDPSICYSDQQLLKVLPETIENKWIWLVDWQKSNSQLYSYTSLTNYTTHKNVLSVSPLRKQHLLCSLQQYCKKQNSWQNTYAYTYFRCTVPYHMQGREKVFYETFASTECINQHFVFKVQPTAHWRLPRISGRALYQSCIIQKIHCSISHLNKVIWQSATSVKNLRNKVYNVSSLT